MTDILRALAATAPAQPQTHNTQPTRLSSYINANKKSPKTITDEKSNVSFHMVSMGKNHAMWQTNV